MNIKDKGMWPEHLPYTELTGCCWEHLLDLRKKTYTAFGALEQKQGYLCPSFSFSSSRGQEQVRIILMRVIEEILEADQASERDHVLEELIDAMNYILILAIADPVFPLDFFIDRLLAIHTAGTRGVKTSVYHFSLATSLMRVVRSCHPVLESLRNRAWQENSQSTYFDGFLVVGTLIINTIEELLKYFENEEEFIGYYLAKDNVLQFRLRTKY